MCDKEQALDAVGNLREAQVAAQISHPNIVEVLDMGRDGASGELFIVHELMSGTDLREWLNQRGRVSLREALALLVPVMEALDAAHERGVVHRDIKPENVFLAAGHGGAGVPKLQVNPILLRASYALIPVPQTSMQLLDDSVIEVTVFGA